MNISKDIVDGERALVAGERPLDALLDLAVLCWEATDPGFAAQHHLTSEAMKEAAQRKNELLNEAVRRFPDSGEARFWSRYIAWLDYGVAVDEVSCREELVRGAVLWALYPAFGTNAARDALREQVRGRTDARARYVRSVLR